jgi:hypothetical protein
MINWLRKNKKSLSIRGIERQLNMPDSTLIKAVNGSQKLAPHWIKPLTEHVKKMCAIQHI